MKSIRWQAFETAENKAFGNACCCRQTAAKAILATVQIDGKTYNVTKIAANAFKGIAKNAKFKVPKKALMMVTAYYRYDSYGIWQSAKMQQGYQGVYSIFLPNSTVYADSTTEHYIAVYDGIYYTYIGSSLSPQTITFYGLSEDVDTGADEQGTEQEQESDMSDSYPILKRKYKKKRRKAVLRCRVPVKKKYYRIAAYYRI